MILPFGEVSVFSLSVAFILGAIIGSFLNVVILRLHTGKSLSGRSHCMSCGTRLTAFDLVPIVSYLALRGACRTCGAHFSLRYMLIELLTASSFVLAYVTAHDALQFIAEAALLSLLIVVLVYDLDHLIIPDEYVAALFVPALVLCVTHITAPYSFASLLWLCAPITASGFFYLLWRVSAGRWIGLGDAKLAAPLSLVLGLNAVFSFIVFSFWIGALLSVTVLGAQRLTTWVSKNGGQRHLRFLGKSLTMRSEIPFAPFLIAGFVLVHYGGFSAFGLIEQLISYVL